VAGQKAQQARRLCAEQVIDPIAEDAEILVGLAALLIPLGRRGLSPGLDAHDGDLGEQETGGLRVM